MPFRRRSDPHDSQCSAFRRRQTRQNSTDTTDSTSSCASTASTLSAPFGPATPPAAETLTSGSYLRGHVPTISCAQCHADLALASQIISKGFTGRHGRAFLVSPTDPTALTSSHTSSPASSSSHRTSLPNTYTQKPVQRHLVTGLHTVSDVACAICGTTLGWKYVEAEEEPQRYKVGKFILETKKTRVGADWEGKRGSGGAWWSSADREDFDDFEEMLTHDGSHLPSTPSTSTTISKSNMGSTTIREDEEVIFDSQDEDECEDLFAGIWSPRLARRRRERRIGVRN